MVWIKKFNSGEIRLFESHPDSHSRENRLLRLVEKSDNADVDYSETPISIKITNEDAFKLIGRNLEPGEIASTEESMTEDELLDELVRHGYLISRDTYSENKSYDNAINWLWNCNIRSGFDIDLNEKKWYFWIGKLDKPISHSYVSDSIYNSRLDAMKELLIKSLEYLK